MRSCDAHNRMPVSSRAEIDVDLVATLPDGGSVYVCTDAVHRFIRDILPTVERPFTLVSGDSDVPISPAMLDAPPMQTLLECPKLLAWYAQNLQTSHHKLHGLPIGLDYHTMWSTPGLWGMTAISPIAQEHALLSAHAASPPYDERYLAAYCNWHFTLSRGDRQECIDRIDKSACFFETHPIPRNSSWQRQAECMFVVSPEGAGMDCHRTWEALLLGCIPIVKRNFMTPMLEDLPVMVVDDWSEVNKARMLEFYSGSRQKPFDLSPLFLAYWKSRFKGEKQATVSPMSRFDFRRLLTRTTG